MKIINYFILVSILFLFVFATQQRDLVTVKTGISEIVYSEKFEQPISIKYKVKCTEGIFSRKGLDFYTNDSIKTSDDLDYINNVYDKGHMVPAADFNCDKKSLIETFSYLNCALQHQDLNRGVWRLLEQHERNLAKKYSVYVEINCKFDSSSIKLTTGSTVPSGFLKKIKYGKIEEKYYFPNKSTKETDYNKFKVK